MLYKNHTVTDLKLIRILVLRGGLKAGKKSVFTNEATPFISYSVHHTITHPVCSLLARHFSTHLIFLPLLISIVS